MRFVLVRCFISLVSHDLRLLLLVNQLLARGLRCDHERLLRLTMHDQVIVIVFILALTTAAADDDQ